MRKNSFDKPKRRLDGKRYECNYEGCEGGTNQSHRTCDYHKKIEAKKRQAEKQKAKESEKSEALEYVKAEIELSKDLKNYAKPKIRHYSKNNLKRKALVRAAMLEFWNLKKDVFHVCYCAEYGTPLHEFSEGNVHHILTQGAYPQAAIDHENMIVLSTKAHQEIHSTDPEKLSIWKDVKKRIDYLKRKYR